MAHAESEIEKIAHREDSSYIGTHIIADFWGCKHDDSVEVMDNILINAAHASNATVLGSVSHQFTPEGCTSLILLAESHISAHTWPEYEYIAVDVFTCGQNMKPQDAIEYLKAKLKPARVEIQTIKRGESKDD